jgi:hypothetical protein
MGVIAMASSSANAHCCWTGSCWYFLLQDSPLCSSNDRLSLQQAGPSESVERHVPIGSLRTCRRSSTVSLSLI